MAPKRHTEKPSSSHSGSSSKTSKTGKTGKTEEKRFIVPRQFTEMELNNCTNNFGHPIAEGSTSKVYRAILDDRIIAIKKYNSGNMQKTYWEVEKEFLSTILHENIINYFGCTNPSSRDCLCLVLEYMPKVLSKELKDLNWQDTVKICTQVASAIIKVHQNLLVIVDLKPENILLDQDNNARLTDFGSVVKESSNLTFMTEGYAPPEIILRRAGRPSDKASWTTDVYAFGIVMLQLLMKTPTVGNPEESGKKILTRRSTKSDEEKHITLRVEELIKKDKRVVHQNLSCSKKEGEEIIKIALDCLKKDKNQRPPMTETHAKLLQFCNK